MRIRGCSSDLCSSDLLYRIEDLFHRLPFHWMWWPAIGAVVVGLGGLIDAHVLGAGYASIEALLNGSLSLRVVAALLVVKAIVCLVALGSGPSGRSATRRVGKECVRTGVSRWWP